MRDALALVLASTLLLAGGVMANASEFVTAQGSKLMLGGKEYEVCAFHAVEGLGAIRFGLAAASGQERSELTLPDSCIEAFKVKVARLLQTVKHMLLDAGFDPAKISERVLSGVRIRSDAIVQEAEAGGYSTIIVGRRGLSRVEAFFMGRVSHAVVHAGNRFSVWII